MEAITPMLHFYPHNIAPTIIRLLFSIWKLAFFLANSIRIPESVPIDLLLLLSYSSHYWSGSTGPLTIAKNPIFEDIGNSQSISKTSRTSDGPGEATLSARTPYQTISRCPENQVKVSQVMMRDPHKPAGKKHEPGR